MTTATATWIVADLATGEVREEERPAVVMSPSCFTWHHGRCRKPGCICDCHQ